MEWTVFWSQFFFYLALLNLIGVVSMVVILLSGLRQIEKLVDLPTNLNLDQKVSIIVAARNEERHIRPAIESLLQQEYGNLELLAINDRSTDKTGRILDELAGDDSRLQVMHLNELPSGWLGKNHALQYGATRASGKWLLFTDADVVMSPTTLRRAVSFAVNDKLDHLAMMPEVRMPSLFLESFVAVFVVGFSLFFRPWKARDPNSDSYLGVGAFNLIRSKTYRAIDGHKPLRMRPDDDVMLGKLVKLHQHRQGVVNGVGLIYVPWYLSVREVVVGLEKNMFAVMDYSILKNVFWSIASLLFFLLPCGAVSFTSGITQMFYLVIIIVLLSLGWRVASEINVRKLSIIFFPVVISLLAYIQWRAMLVTIINGGIHWRETFYPLADLKSNKL